jgi:hypothetical protein
MKNPTRFSISSFAALLLLALPSHAATIAHWDFEDGTAGQSFTPDGDPNGSGGSVDTASGILMRGWNTSFGPSFTASTAPNGGSLAMRNNSQDGYVTGGALHNWAPEVWTIEATVSLVSLAGWRTVIGRDGSSVASPESDFYLQNNGIDNKFRVNLVTASGERVVFDGNYNIQTDAWYALALRSDGVTLSMWLDDGSGYQMIGSQNYLGASPADNALRASNHTWTFGRGWYNGGFVDHINGSMDNIRFSDTALAPSEMIALVPEPTSTLLAALGGLALLRRRRA